MSSHAAVYVAVQHAPGTAGVPGGLTGGQYAVLGGCVVLLALIGLLGLLTGSTRSGMATPRAARRLMGEAGLGKAAAQLRPSLLEPDDPAHQPAALPGPRGSGREHAPGESAPGGSAPAGAGGRRS